MTFGRFQRMLAIPEEEYKHLKSLQQTTTNPLESKLISLSKDYQKQSFIKDPQIQVQRQGETLNEMMNLKDELKHKLIELTPKPYQSRAQNLFGFINEKLNVSDKGEIIDSDGKTIIGSNIGDLIQHAVRDRRRNYEPLGWNSFLKLLRDNNTPKMILNYDTLEELHQPVTSNIKQEPFIIGAAKTPDSSSTSRGKMSKQDSPAVKHRTKRVKKVPEYLKEFDTKTSKAKKPKHYV